MRRRRRQNPLLAKTILIGVGMTILILPILAKLGLFKQLHDQYVQTELVNLPPPPPQPKEQKPKAKKAVKAPPHAAAHRGTVQRATRSATVPVHVEAGTVRPGSSGSDTNTIVNNNGGALGVLPAAPATPVTPPTPPVVVQQAPPPPTLPVVPPQPVVPAVIEAEPVYQPQPVIPEDLLDSANDVDATFYGYFTIHPDGTVDVKMVQSTGDSVLDRLAIDAAKQWRFTPATKDGIPVESYRRLQVEFVVS
jgi:periplasmic protein TonB